MTLHRTTTDTASNYRGGFTTVELIVAIFISSLLILSIVAFIVALTKQYSISVARNILTTELSSTVNRIDSDVRASDSVLATSPVDPAGPLSSGKKWSTNTSTSKDTIVLTTIARTTSGDPVNNVYPGLADIIVYYVRNGSLYRRLVAANESDNRYSTLLCATTSDGGCSADEKLLDNVTEFNVTFYGTSGLTSSPSQAKNLNFTIKAETTEAGQPISQTSTISAHLSGTPTQHS